MWGRHIRLPLGRNFPAADADPWVASRLAYRLATPGYDQFSTGPCGLLEVPFVSQPVALRLNYASPIEYTNSKLSYLSCMGSTINVDLLVTQMKLWCILEGQGGLFKVQVNDEDEVYDLQKAIKTELSSTLSNVDAMFIKLWRISKSLHEARQLTGANLEGEERPSPRVSVGKYWPDLTAEVHVFVANPLGKSI